MQWWVKDFLPLLKYLTIVRVKVRLVAFCFLLLFFYLYVCVCVYFFFNHLITKNISYHSAYCQKPTLHSAPYRPNCHPEQLFPESKFLCQSQNSYVKTLSWNWQRRSHLHQEVLNTTGRWGHWTPLVSVALNNKWVPYHQTVCLFAHSDTHGTL